MKLLGLLFSARFRRLAACFIFAGAFFLARKSLGQYVFRRSSLNSAAHPSSSAKAPRSEKAHQGPTRFLGWKYASRAGGAYFRHFARRRHGLAIPVQRSSSSSSSINGPGTMFSASSLVSPPPLPGFLFRPALPAGFLPTSVATGDFNGDGCADVVIEDNFDLANRFLGNCDGTFQTEDKIFGIGELSYGIAMAVVNGDGYLDLVSSGSVAGIPPLDVGQQAGNLVSVMFGDGTGNLNPPAVYRGHPGMFSLAIADLNGDGHPEILTANQQDDSASVYTNDGQGGFGQPQGGYVGYETKGNSGPTNIPGNPIVAKDVNGDGKPDLSVLEENSTYTFAVVLNQGGGIFSQQQRWPLFSAPTCAGDFALANFRNTGLPDLLVDSNPFSIGSSWFALAPNNGNGSFGQGTLESVTGAQGLIGVGDFNRDGKLDFVAAQQIPGIMANSSSSELTVYLGDGSGSFTPGYQTEFNVNSSLGPSNVFAGDFNGDGKLDVLVQEGSSLEGTLGHDVYEFLGNGDGTFAPPVIVLTNFGPFSMGDLNHDGRPDIVEQLEPLTTLPNGLPPEFAIYLGQPDGTFKLTNTYEPYAGQIDVQKPFLGDFNGDGNLDIAAFQFLPVYPESGMGTGYPYFQVLLGNGDGTFTPTYTTFDLSGVSLPQLASDVTGDGRADLIELDGFTSSYHVVPATTGPALQIHLVSDPVVGSNGNVQINLAVASSSSTTINLSASDPAITIPSSVTIPAGSVSLDVPFQIDSTFNPNHVFSIQAQLGTETDTAYGTQATKAAGLQVSLTALQYVYDVAPGETTPDYWLQVFSVDGYSTTVQLQCLGLPAGATCQLGSDSLQLPGNTYAQTNLAVATSSTLVPGTYPFTILATDGTVSGQTSGTLVVVPGPSIELSPTSLSFPMQTVGTTSAPQTVTLTNVGDATMTPSISLFGPESSNFAQTNNCGGSLAVGASCTINVTFVPTTTGSITGTVEIDANTVGATRSSVTLNGTAEGSLVQLSTSSLNFNDEYVGATSAPQTVTVWNTGTVPTSLSGITVTGANTTDFTMAVSGTNCSTATQLDVGLGCAINITFAPSAAGTRTAILSIADNAGGSPQTVSLSGNGQSPDFTLGPAPGSSSSATVGAGGSATYSIAVAPLGAFNQTVSLACPGAPSGATCSVSPSSVTLNGAAQDAKVSVTTSAGTLAVPRAPGPVNMPPIAWWAALLGLIGLVMLARLSARGATGRPRFLDSPGTVGRLGYAVTLGAILLTVMLWVSCGGGGSGLSTAPSSTPATPAGNYALTVTGTSGSVNHSTILTLMVK